MIIVSNLDSKDYHEILKDIYRNVYIEYVCKNPLATPNEEIKNPAFTQALREMLTRYGAITFTSS